MPSAFTSDDNLLEASTTRSRRLIHAPLSWCRSAMAFIIASHSIRGGLPEHVAMVCLRRNPQNHERFDHMAHEFPFFR